MAKNETPKSIWDTIETPKSPKKRGNSKVVGPVLAGTLAIGGVIGIGKDSLGINAGVPAGSEVPTPVASQITTETPAPSQAEVSPSATPDVIKQLLLSQILAEIECICQQRSLEASASPSASPTATEKSVKTPEPVIVYVPYPKPQTPKATPKPTAKPTPEASAKLDYYKSIEAGGSYNVLAGQRVEVTGDVTIDGLDYHDDNPDTTAVDVLVDGKAHHIFAKWGASVDIFSKSAPVNYLKEKYNQAVNKIRAGGKTLDPTSLNEFEPLPKKSYFVPTIPANGEYQVPEGQRVIVPADVTIDGVKRYDGNPDTISENVIIDGKAHTIVFPYGGTVEVFTPAATTQYIEMQYQAQTAGKNVDPTNLNELPK